MTTEYITHSANSKVNAWRYLCNILNSEYEKSDNDTVLITRKYIFKKLRAKAENNHLSYQPTTIDTYITQLKNTQFLDSTDKLGTYEIKNTIPDWLTLTLLNKPELLEKKINEMMWDLL